MRGKGKPYSHVVRIETRVGVDASVKAKRPLRCEVEDDTEELPDPFGFVAAAAAAGSVPQPRQLRCLAIGAAAGLQWDFWELWAGSATLTTCAKAR